MPPKIIVRARIISRIFQGYIAGDDEFAEFGVVKLIGPEPLIP